MLLAAILFYVKPAFVPFALMAALCGALMKGRRNGSR